MERYESYKDSGVEWIGEIPEEWTKRRISALYNARNVKVSDRDFPPLSVTMQGILPQLETAAKTQDGDNRKLVKKGDFVINSRSDRRGACGISDRDGSVTLISNVLAPKSLDRMNNRYFSYLFKTEGFADEFYKCGTGIVDDLWSTNWSRMKNMDVCIPGLPEQEAIANWLDERTAEIDSLIAETERSVELFEKYRKSVISEAVTKGLDPDALMKDSGIERIGEIPEEWNIAALGNISYIRARLGWRALKAEEYVDEGYPMYSAFNIVSSKFVSEPVNFITEERYLESPEIMLTKGDILLVKDGAGVGKCAVLREDIGPSTVNGSIAVITPDNCLDSRYLHYFFDSNSFQHFSRMLMGGMGVPHLFQRDIKKMKVVVPNCSEQRRIADYLDAQTQSIDDSIKAKERTIDLLREYRKSLISEAVTGKFKVPGVE